MYQPETEDLVPRCAPKPSTLGSNEASARPSVPEVSIVFTQPESLQASSTPPSSTTSYAAWKKQCLPHVVYPPTAEVSSAEYATMTARSNVYPMRTAVTSTSTMNASGSQFCLAKSEPPSKTMRNLCVFTQPQCNMESPLTHCNPTYTAIAPCCKMSSQQRTFDQIHLPQQNNNVNTLTICAGTQTESVSLDETNDLIDKLATKEDIAKIKTMIVGMRLEQRRLMEILQHFMIAHGKTENEAILHKSKDAATQWDTQPSVGPLPQKRAYIRYDSIEEEDSIEEDDSYRFQKKINVVIESPPIQKQFSPQEFRPPNLPRTDIVSSFPKSATEQSMVMNELALKYLPNEKLSELLQGLHVSPAAQQPQYAKNVYESPLKNIENYGKSPSDLSTASYKYLKKYRLLPEENNNLSPSANIRKLNYPSQQENMLDLETIRRQPKFM